MDPSTTGSATSLQNTSPRVDPTDITQMQAMVVYQGELTVHQTTNNHLIPAFRGIPKKC